MKQRAAFALAGFFIIPALISGCASAWDTRSIEQKYSNQLEQLSPGVSLQSFKEVFPQAFLKGQTFTGGSKISAYGLIWRHTEHRMGDRTTEELWFYFRDGKLLKWGAPGDWPAPSEMKLELR